MYNTNTGSAVRNTASSPDFAVLAYRSSFFDPEIRTRVKSEQDEHKVMVKKILGLNPLV